MPPKKKPAARRNTYHGKGGPEVLVTDQVGGGFITDGLKAVTGYKPLSRLADGLKSVGWDKGNVGNAIYKTAKVGTKFGLGAVPVEAQPNAQMGMGIKPRSVRQLR